MYERYESIDDFKRDLAKYQTTEESIDICSSTISKEFWGDIFEAINKDCNNLVFLTYLEGFDDCMRIPFVHKDDCEQLLREKEFKDYIYQPAGHLKDSSKLLYSIRKLDKVSKKYRIPLEIIITFKSDESNEFGHQVYLNLN